MSKQFKAGDKVRCIRNSAANPQLVQDAIYTVFAVLPHRHGYDRLTLVGVNEEDRRTGFNFNRFELVTPAFCLTACYLDDEERGQGFTQFFDTEQAARDYVKEHGNRAYVYVLSRCTLVESLRVVEQTTVTRTVVTA